MSTQTPIKLFLVDDDAVFLRLLAIEFQQTGNFEVQTFPTGESCLEHLIDKPDVIVLDYHLDGIDTGAMNGIETLDKIKERNVDIPVVMLSSQDKIDVAIKCMHHKAFDYVVKSETAFLRIHKIITTILQYKKIESELNWYMDRM